MSISPDETEAKWTDLPQRQWSDQQQAIFRWFAKDGSDTNHDGNLLVRARAGSGKTTTIIEGINRAPENKIVMGAFNKRIADTLSSLITNQYAVAKTMHGLGYGCLMSAWNGIQMEKERFRRQSFLADTVCGKFGPMVPFDVVKLVTKLHTKAREITPHACQHGDLRNLSVDFDIEPDETMARAGYDMDWVEARALEAMELAAADRPNDTGIDLADMIFIPIRNKLLRPRFNLGVIDETQDLTEAQLELFLGLMKGRVCIVGDDRQAIYGFRGASVGSIDRLKRHLDATELTLNTTYRCGTSIVDIARTLVPDFQAGPNNPPGEVSRIGIDDLAKKAQHGDFILSRVNAPLTTIALQLLAMNKRARVAGRDIGTHLKSILDKLKARSIPELNTKIVAWRDKEIAHLRTLKREDKIDEVYDKAETLLTLAHDSKSVNDLYSRIDSLFTDDGLGAAGVMTCSSVHKAKGLEADRVFILESTIKGLGKSADSEEANIAYVAITRARKELVWVVE